MPSTVNKPKVSICIPTFNSAVYLRDCIESALAQPGTDFEIVICDNASDDDSWNIIQSFSDPRIRAFRSDQNRGMATNFNWAVREARGEYVNLLCSDDLLEPNALQLHVEFLDRHPEFSMSTCVRRLIDSADQVFATVEWFSRPVVIEAASLRTIFLIYGNIVGEPSAVLFRKAAWLRSGPFQDGLRTLIDLDMWLRMSHEGGVGYLPVPLCRIRRHARSMTSHFLETGTAQEADLQVAEALLSELQPGRLLRKISRGKVAGAYLRNAWYGLKYGLVRRPASFVATAFGLDPAFLGLFFYLTLFRPGFLGFKIGDTGRPFLCGGSTLDCAPELG